MYSDRCLGYDSAENCGISAVAVLTRWSMSLSVQFIDGIDVAVIMQRRRVSRWRCLRLSSSPELVDIPVCYETVGFRRGFGGGDVGLGIFRAPPNRPGVERQFSEPSMTKRSIPISFVFAPVTMDVSGQPSTRAAQRPLVVATRAAVDRCVPGHVYPPLIPTGTEEGQGRGGGERVELHGQGPENSSSPAGALQHVRRRARREAACQPGRAAGAAGADPAAHRGAACRNCSHGADPRRSCAAASGPAGRSAQTFRHHGSRAGDRSAQKSLLKTPSRSALCSACHRWQNS